MAYHPNNAVLSLPPPLPSPEEQFGQHFSSASRLLVSCYMAVILLWCCIIIYWIVSYRLLPMSSLFPLHFCLGLLLRMFNLRPSLIKHNILSVLRQLIVYPFRATCPYRAAVIVETIVSYEWRHITLFVHICIHIGPTCNKADDKTQVPVLICTITE